MANDVLVIDEVKGCSESERKAIVKKIRELLSGNQTARKFAKTIISEIRDNAEEEKKYVRFNTKSAKDDIVSKVSGMNDLKDKKDFCVIGRKVKTQSGKVKEKYLLIAPRKTLLLFETYIGEEKQRLKALKKRSELSMREMMELAEQMQAPTAKKIGPLSAAELTYIRQHAWEKNLKFAISKNAFIDKENRAVTNYNVSILNDKNGRNEAKICALIAGAACVYSDRRPDTDGVAIGEKLTRLANEQHQNSRTLQKLINNPESIDGKAIIVSPDRFSDNAKESAMLHMILSKEGLKIYEKGMRPISIPISEKEELKKMFYLTQARIKNATLLKKEDEALLNEKNNELAKKYSPEKIDKSMENRLEMERRMIDKILGENDISSMRDAISVVSMVKNASTQSDIPLSTEVVNSYVKGEIDKQDLNLALNAPITYALEHDMDLTLDSTLPSGEAFISMEQLEKLASVTVNTISAKDFRSEYEVAFSQEKIQEEKEEVFEVVTRSTAR